MRHPLKSSVISQPFGSNEVDYSQFGLLGHHGCDYQATVGTPVYAPEDGIVEFSQNGLTDKYTGRHADGEIITINGTYEHWLMHLSKRLVSAGDHVKEGQLIAYSGNTGFTTGPHLHWGTRPLHPDLSNGYRGFVDPEKVLKQGDKMSDLADHYFVQACAEAILGRTAAGDQNLLNNIGRPKTEVLDTFRSYPEAKLRASRADAPQTLNKNSIIEYIKNKLT